MICEKTVKRYCTNYFDIENYDKAIADKTQTWDCHHRLEEEGYSIKKLIKQNLYFNRPPEELIFLLKSDHMRIHGYLQPIGEDSPFYGRIGPNLGNPMKEETKQKLSQANLGKKLTLKTRQKISEANKRRKHTDESIKKMSEAHKGEKNPMYGIPSPMKGKHHSDEVKKKQSEIRKAWWAKRKQQKNI